MLPLVQLCLGMPAMRQEHVMCSGKQEHQGWAGLSWHWPGSPELSRTEAATNPPACFNRTSGLHAKALIWRASVRPKHTWMSHTCSLKLHHLIAEAFRESVIPMEAWHGEGQQEVVSLSFLILFFLLPPHPPQTLQENTPELTERKLLKIQN